MMKKIVTDYVSWLFFPSRFVFPQESVQPPSGTPSALPTIRIPGWETLELKVDPTELAAFNRLVGETFLGGSGNEFLVPLFGKQSAFTLDGPQHRLARKLISQSINKACIERVVEHVPQFLTYELPQMFEGERMRVGQVMRRVTMRAMCLAILGSTDEALFERLLRRFEATTGYFANLVSYNKAFWHPGRRLSIGTEVKRRKDEIDKVIFQVIETRRNSLSEGGDREDEPRDLLSHLVKCQGEYGYSDEFIRDNLVSTMAAGYDTTGAAITWMLFWLGKDGQSRRALNEHYHISSADYDLHAEAFISESMRYCPPLEILPRRPITLKEGSEIPQKHEPTLVCPCPHQIHHNSAIYGDPEKFRPERFLEHKFAPTEYFPFGLGNRLCLGVVLAPKVMKATLDWFMSKELYLHFRKTRFRPIRRNVSLWPDFSTKAKVMRIQN